MQVHHLQLKNYRRFEHFEMELGERFTLLAGNNGAGKSNIIEGLFVGLRQLFHHLHNLGPLGIRKHQIRLQAVSSSKIPMMEPQYPSRITLSGFSYLPYTFWMEQTSEIQSHQSDNPLAKALEQARNAIQKGTPTPLPLLACYWSRRPWLDSGRKFSETGKPGSRLNGYTGWFDAATNLTDLLLWFKTQELIALQRGETSESFEVIRQGLIRFLPKVDRIYWDIAQDELTLVTKDGAMPFDMLSDGYRNMVAMVADIAYRSAVLNPHFGKRILDETEGVVLIDELDLHLHPKWQQNVVANLMQVFPKIQFVAATHSPFIIQSLRTGQGCLLINLDDREQGETVDWLSLEEVAEDIQGVEHANRHPRYNEMMAAAKQYYIILKDAESASPEALDQLRKRLDELTEPYGDDPAYQAFLAIERQGSGIDQRES